MTLRSRAFDYSILCASTVYMFYTLTAFTNRERERNRDAVDVDVDVDTGNRTKRNETHEAEMRRFARRERDECYQKSNTTGASSRAAEKLFAFSICSRLRLFSLCSIAPPERQLLIHNCLSSLRLVYCTCQVHAQDKICLFAGRFTSSFVNA